MWSRFLLLPFSFLYGLALRLRHWTYDKGWLSSVRFGFPVIVVGNLSLGGTGKTPHTLHIARVLGERYKVALLSRGYGRRTKGYREVQAGDRPERVGDEPLLFKRELPGIPVGVCEDRVRGISRLQQDHPSIDLVLLDDAFQHRRLQPGLSILLFDYASFSRPFNLLPAGRLRDTWERRLQADLLVVSKCPPDLSQADRAAILRKLAPRVEQPVFFSRYEYAPLRSYGAGVPLEHASLRNKKIILVTGIADASPILRFLREKGGSVEHLRFPDHHPFKKSDLNRVQQIIKFAPDAPLVLTTQKDQVKIAPLLREKDKAGWYVLPVSVVIENNEHFEKQLYEYIGTDQRNG